MANTPPFRTVGPRQAHFSSLGSNALFRNVLTANPTFPQRPCPGWMLYAGDNQTTTPSRGNQRLANEAAQHQDPGMDQALIPCLISHVAKGSFQWATGSPQLPAAASLFVFARSSCPVCLLSLRPHSVFCNSSSAQIFFPESKQVENAGGPTTSMVLQLSAFWPGLAHLAEAHCHTRTN